jgi:hypothetical protein
MCIEVTIFKVDRACFFPLQRRTNFLCIRKKRERKKRENDLANGPGMEILVSYLFVSFLDIDVGFLFHSLTTNSHPLILFLPLYSFMDNTVGDHLTYKNNFILIKY